MQEEKAIKDCTFVPDTRETKRMTKRLVPNSSEPCNVAESIILRGKERRAKTEVMTSQIFVHYALDDETLGSNGNDSNGASRRRASRVYISTFNRK